MKNIIKEFFDTDFVSKIRTTKKVDEYINIEDMTGDEVAKEFNEAKEAGFNPCFGVYSSGGCSMDGYIVWPAMIIEVEVNKPDKEFKIEVEKYINTNAFSFIANRLPKENYKRLSPSREDDVKFNTFSFYELYLKRDEKGLIEKMSIYWQKIN